MAIPYRPAGGAGASGLAGVPFSVTARSRAWRVSSKLSLAAPESGGCNLCKVYALTDRSCAPISRETWAGVSFMRLGDQALKKDEAASGFPWSAR